MDQTRRTITLVGVGLNVEAGDPVTCGGLMATSSNRHRWNGVPPRSETPLSGTPSAILDCWQRIDSNDEETALALYDKSMGKEKQRTLADGTASHSAVCSASASTAKARTKARRRRGLP